MVHLAGRSFHFSEACWSCWDNLVVSLELSFVLNIEFYRDTGSRQEHAKRRHPTISTVFPLQVPQRVEILPLHGHIGNCAALRRFPFGMIGLLRYNDCHFSFGFLPLRVVWTGPRNRRSTAGCFRP